MLICTSYTNEHFQVNFVPILETLDIHQAGVPTEGEHSYNWGRVQVHTKNLKISLETFVNKIINNNKHTHNKPIDK